MSTYELLKAGYLRLPRTLALSLVISSIMLSNASSQTAEQESSEALRVEQSEIAAELEVTVRMNALQTSPQNGDEASFLEYQRESAEVGERLKRFRESQARGDRSEKVEELRAELQMAVVRLMDLLPKVNAPMTWELIESFEAVLLPESERSVRSGTDAR